MKIFTEKALAKYVDEKIQRVRDWDIQVRETDRLNREIYSLNAEHCKLAERVKELERRVDEIRRKHSEDHEVCEAIRKSGAIRID